jgi:hypothetical protein
MVVALSLTVFVDYEWKMKKFTGLVGLAWMLDLDNGLSGLYRSCLPVSKTMEHILQSLYR